jgi:queuine tRNA-ribosyltransferase
VVSIQRNLGSDVLMVLDECVGYGRTTTTRRAPGADHPLGRALPRGLSRGQRRPTPVRHRPGRLHSRTCEKTSLANWRKSLRRLRHGGLSVGESIPEMYESWATSPRSSPRTSPATSWAWARHGHPHGIAAGVDLFDCVSHAQRRNGTLLHLPGQGEHQARRVQGGQLPLDPACHCYAARFSRAYLRHLYVAAKSILPPEHHPQPDLLPEPGGPGPQGRGTGAAGRTHGPLRAV